MVLSRFALSHLAGFNQAFHHETFNCNGHLVNVTYTVHLKFLQSLLFLVITGGKTNYKHAYVMTMMGIYTYTLLLSTYRMGEQLSIMRLRREARSA